MSDNDDMATMPVRDLITSIRERTKRMKGGDIVVILTLNVLARRLEQEADRADDKAAEFVRMENAWREELKRWQGEQIVQDLAMLVRRLAAKLRVEDHEKHDKVLKQVNEFLEKHDLQGNMLRTQDGGE